MDNNARAILEPTRETFRRAVSLTRFYTQGDQEALSTILADIHGDPVVTGATICALIKLVCQVDRQRPDDLDEWLGEILLNMARDEAN